MTKTTREPRVRFAPSPTGELHVGNARTALFNWLFARHHGGRFILRIEDTDRERTTKAFADNLLADLKWLGIDWDEGPGVGGPFGPYNQSERLDLYTEHLNRLIGTGRVYPCYCTEEELEAERISLLSRHLAPRYMGRCRHLTPDARKRLEDEGRRPAWRFQVGSGPIAFNDLIRGSVRFDAEAIGDFIIVRSNGIPAYNFAVVIDDHLMAITHVVRGEDHLSNTAMQLLLYGVFGFEPPAFAHHALILGKDRAKLSKRHGSVAVREFRNKGYLPEVMINYLAQLGGSIGEGKEVCTAAELIRSFSLDRAGKSGAIFDEDKLRWLSGIYIRRENPAMLTEHLLPFIRQAGYDTGSMDKDRLVQIVDAVKDNLVTLTDIGDLLAMFLDDRYDLSAEGTRVIREDESRRVLHTLYDVLRESGDRIEYAKLAETVGQKTGLKGRKLLMPIRAAITGRTKGPELDRVVALLARSSLLKRVERAIALTAGS
jgi:nondiscriminating glutamyl-tRNA synthetase